MTRPAVRRLTPFHAGPHTVAELRTGGYVIVDARTGRPSYRAGRRAAIMRTIEEARRVLTLFA